MSTLAINTTITPSAVNKDNALIAWININPTHAGDEIKIAMKEYIRIKEAFPLKTRGGDNKANSFKCQYDVHKNLTITNVYETVDSFNQKEIKDILIALYKNFGNNYFPLRNQLDKFNDPIYRKTLGLGTTIYDVTRNNTKGRAASYFGPVMEKFGIFQYDATKTVTHWKLLVNPTAAGFILPSPAINENTFYLI